MRPVLPSSGLFFLLFWRERGLPPVETFLRWEAHANRCIQKRRICLPCFYPLHMCFGIHFPCTLFLFSFVLLFLAFSCWFSSLLFLLFSFFPFLPPFPWSAIFRWCCVCVRRPLSAYLLCL